MNGFLFLRRDYMLIITLLTLYLGPAIVLIVIGLFGASIAAFAVYPVHSVLFLWTWFFLTSQIAQALGKYLGLDRDKDGDVDMLDFVFWASETKSGKKMIGLPRVYAMLNELSRDPFPRNQCSFGCLDGKAYRRCQSRQDYDVSTRIVGHSSHHQGEHRS